MPQPQKPEEWSVNENDYITPEQRLNAVAEILATLALRALKQKHENQNP